MTYPTATRIQSRLLSHVSSDNPLFAGIAEFANNPVLSVIDELFAAQDERNQVVFDMADKLREQSDA